MNDVKLSDNVNATKKLLHVELIKLFFKFNVVKFGNFANTNASAAKPMSDIWQFDKFILYSYDSLKRFRRLSYSSVPYREYPAYEVLCFASGESRDGTPSAFVLKFVSAGS